MIDRRDLPLFAFGDALRAARRQRRTIVRRSVAIGIGLVCVGLTIACPPRPRLVWNASASAPIGLYAVAPGDTVARGDMVIARTPISVREMAARRHYIPANVPLVKRVAGVPGNRICGIGNGVFVDGRRVATRLAHDASGRPLPWWTGCRTLTDGALLLLMAETPDSFDGRYFGPTSASDVVGKATALWVR
ncbi:S26 family signal peptidase [Sphingomonas sp. PP-CE-1G-424]|uniref:S26 family signal peptidase n=1 Tax=Sphingomonas sp. PP-CE-1G-424 TaxID=2135658 RepID=UPI0010552E74|nr:S26 family signal peptidase [Sphingomonas sp. PP-CE-1G-424]TCP65484.1 conjugative transfer signal peptidase TraF [Sphingomonas sp. PP-CE-1G-424]